MSLLYSLETQIVKGPFGKGVYRDIMSTKRCNPESYTINIRTGNVRQCIWVSSRPVAAHAMQCRSITPAKSNRSFVCVLVRICIIDIVVLAVVKVLLGIVIVV
jgi:hypothetical protein